jgi:hypothetical protein
MPSKGPFDTGPVDFRCQVDGCTRTIKTTVGALRGNPTLRCSAGHTNVIDGKQFDKDVKQGEKRIRDAFK